MEFSKFNSKTSNPSVLIIEESDFWITSIIQTLKTLKPEMTIITCNSSLDALALIKSNIENNIYIDTVITENEFSGELSGTLLVNKIKEIIPNAHCIIISSKPKNEVLLNTPSTEKSSMKNYIEKPITLSELNNKIKENLVFSQDKQ
jgi:response regulator RpfG family c-di-GMP phosphodiesterase